MKLVVAVLAALSLVLVSGQSAFAGEVLDHVTSAGAVACGVVTEEADYSKDDTHGGLVSLGIDVCKAVAAAVFGAGDKVEVSAFPDEQHGLEAVKSRKIALLAGATPSLTNGALYGVGFARPVFFDGQGFLVAKAARIESINDLAGKQVCFIASTEAETLVDAVLADRNIKILPFPFEEQGEMEAALATHHCAAITGDISQLAKTLSAFHGRSNDFKILGETISFDPLAPAYRNDDPQWAAIVGAVRDALIQAEASSVTQATVDAMSESADPVVKRLLTKAGAAGRSLGLSDDWAVRVVKTVGNYGEIYERDVGAGSPLRLPRGMNSLWTQGGLMYPFPMR